MTGLIKFLNTLAVCSIVASGTALAQEPRVVAIERYLATVFRQNDTLTKFPTVPRIAIVCDNQSCKPIVEELRAFIPRELNLETVSNMNADSDIVIVLSSSKNADLDANAAKIGRKFPADVGLHSWGQEACAVRQWRNGNQVRQLLVSVDASENQKIMINCMLFELFRGSGAQSSFSFPSHISRLARLNAKQYKTYLSAMKFYLRVHWSPATKPGFTKDRTRNILLKAIRPKNNKLPNTTDDQPI
jgi:hypothetical protein